MAAAFVGLNVSVKLKEPAVVLHGLVSDVKGQRLYLTQVHFLKSGKHLDNYTIHGAEIADIEVLPASSVAAIPTAAIDNGPLCQAASGAAGMEPIVPQELSGTESISKGGHQSPVRSSLPPSQMPPSSKSASQIFDPAILSFSRTPTAPNPTPLLTSTNARPAVADSFFPASPANMLRQNSANYNTSIPLESTKELPHPSSAGVSSSTRNLPAPLAPPFEPAEIGGNENDMDEVDIVDAVRLEDQGSYDGSRPSGTTKSRRRRRRRPKPKDKEVNSLKDEDSSPEVRQNLKQDLRADSASGWRQTPMLQSSAAEVLASSPRSTPGLIGGKVGRIAAVSSAKKSRRQKDLARESANGWATEDASDVHGLGEFDFEANLLQFDKRAVWDELRNGDTTADEDRLVSLNRAKPSVPGTFGGKKLLPTENVLDRPRVNSQDFEDDRNGDNADLGIARLLKRSQSKSSTRPLGSRKDSQNQGLEHPNSLQSSQASFTHRTASLVRYPDSGGSPRFHPTASPSSSGIFSPHLHGREGSPCLRYTESDNVCRTMAPETLEAVENLAHNGFSMSEDVLAENAGRGIAEMVLQTINPKGRRLGQRNHNSLPVVVILVGDNKAGGRALAAARHLLERNVRVVASLPGKIDLEAGPLSSQIHRFKGKFLRSWSETSAYVKTLDAPPELIVDALLGVHSRFVDMDPDHMETALDMVAWANKSKASVLAIDLPSGIDSSTGQVEMRQGEPAEARAKIVVCCGAPCTGLLQAMISRQNEDDWRVFVVDIGINPAAKPFLKVNTNQKDSAPRGKYIHFGNGWVVGVRYDAGALAI